MFIYSLCIRNLSLNIVSGGNSGKSSCSWLHHCLLVFVLRWDSWSVFRWFSPFCVAYVSKTIHKMSAAGGLTTWCKLHVFTKLCEVCQEGVEFRSTLTWSTTWLTVQLLLLHCFGVSAQGSRAGGDWRVYVATIKSCFFLLLWQHMMAGTAARVQNVLQTSGCYSRALHWQLHKFTLHNLLSVFGGGGDYAPAPALDLMCCLQARTLCPPQAKVLKMPGLVGRPNYRQRANDGSVWKTSWCFFSVQVRGLDFLTCVPKADWRHTRLQDDHILRTGWLVTFGAAVWWKTPQNTRSKISKAAVIH